MFLDLDEHPEKVEGVGQLLFEMCRGVRNMLHSCAGKVSSGVVLGVCVQPWTETGKELGEGVGTGRPRAGRGGARMPAFRAYCPLQSLGSPVPQAPGGETAIGCWLSGAGVAAV